MLVKYTYKRRQGLQQFTEFDTKCTLLCKPILKAKQVNSQGQQATNTLQTGHLTNAQTQNRILSIIWLSRKAFEVTKVTRSMSRGPRT